MIFKKIYTFLNNIFNGNSFSKLFLVSILILLSSFVAFELKATVDTPLKTNIESTATANVPTLNGDATNEFHILYAKNGLQPIKIYTSYLPPENTYESVPAEKTTTEHTLRPCEIMASIGVDMIGNDCMIKIPFDCATPAHGTVSNPGVNCLDYGLVFKTISNSKNFEPRECDATLQDKRTCLSTSKPYCHNIDNPILGINCKLAPCNAIPNQKYRRPGVNCMADCNDATSNSISNSKFFMEGFNCLSSCDSIKSSRGIDPIIGENCVLEFNDYVTPLCNKDNLFPTAKFFNKSSNAFFPREQCLDVIDLPLCAGSETITANNCVPECRGNPSGHGTSCINFDSSAGLPNYTNKKCHHYLNPTELNANPNCAKLNCHNLSITELQRSLNAVDFSIPTISNQKYCTPTKYTNFSFKQFKAINENTINGNSQATAYLRDYQLDNKPCYSQEDTEAIETILSSSFYGGNTDSTGATNNKITFLKNQCKETSKNPSSPTNIGCSENAIDRKKPEFNPDFLYDKTSVCKFINIPEMILCTNYKKSPVGTAPFDCNSKTLCSFANGDCQTSGICSDPGDDYCYKIDINCNLSKNKDYEICKVLNTSSAKTDNGDPYVSWFFRPTISPKSLIDAPGGGKKLLNMTGYPVTNTKDILHQNDYLKTTIDDLWANGKVSATISNGSEVPGASDYDAGVRTVGPANICGMNSNFRGIPSDDFAYFKGDVKTTYELDDKISHSVDICIRYVSSSSLTQSCGHRNCLNNCAFIFGGNTGVCTKICGYDICKTLSIVEGPKERIRNCASNRQNFIRTSYNIGRGANRILGFDNDECIKTYETTYDKVSKNTRVRIFKPESSNYICAVAEFTDITTASLSRPYFDGDEFFSVPDGKGGFKKLCVSGTYVQSTDSCENGFDTNQMDIFSRVWRTAKIIKYIQEPPMDYIDTTGVGPVNMSSKYIDPITRKEVKQTIGRVDFNTKRYFETSDCVKHKNRISSPALFSKATLINSERLFLPNVIIEGVCKISKKPIDGQAPAPPVCDNPEIAGKTDFLKPAIKILYGKKGASTDLSDDTLSRFHNYKIIGINYENSNTSTNPVNNNEYVIKPFNIGIQDTDRIIKKVTLLKESRYDENSKSKLKPVACLYAKKDNPGRAPAGAAAGAGAAGAAGAAAGAGAAGAAGAAAGAGAAGAAGAAAGAGAAGAAAGAVATPATDDKGDFIGCVDRKRATMIPIINAKPATLSYNNLEFQVGFTATNKSDIQLTNLSNDIKNKSNLTKCVNIESQGYKICIKRDECSLLNIECVDNEKSLIDELQNPDQHMLSIPSRQATSNYCKNELLVKCNEKKGLTGANTRYKTLDPDSTYGFNQPASSDYYGWHNEVCVVEGFENLDDPDKEVYVEQKVLSDGAIGSCIKKPGLTDANCAACDNTITAGCTKIGCCQIVTRDTENSRPATPHELGYCVENTIYKNSCPAIKYYEKNSDTSDMYFTSPQYLDSVHLSHNARNTNTPINGVAQNDAYGHAEYEIAYDGNTGIAGACNGFFQKPVNGFPSASCSYLTSLTGWVFNARGACIRYSCPALTVPSYGANISGNYESNYDATTIDGSKKGSSHGYASNWSPTTITDLTKKTIGYGTTCIPGYKKNGQTTSLKSAQRSALNIPALSGYQEKIDSLFGAINYNNGGLDPTRNCNQVGQWESVTNPCERITCPALNFIEPTESNAIDLNDFGEVKTLTRSGGVRKVIYASKMSPGLVLTKVKFSISTTINGGNIYLNANSYPPTLDSDTINDFIIKNRDDNNDVSTIQSGKTYVLQKISNNYWKILNNDNDAELKRIWEKSGGASFPSAKAIRSNLFYYNNLPDIEDKHTITGVCGAGYKQLGASPPEFTCDSKGNWTLLKNRCVSECKAVNSPVADDPSHGFATWSKVDRQALGSSLIDSSACSSGYIPYPYTPIYDDQGVVKYPYEALPGDQGFTKYSLTPPLTVIEAEPAYDAETTYRDDTYKATVSAPSPENFQGAFYNLKINTGAGGGNNLGEKTFYLTSNSLGIQSPANTKWSRIKFASFGKPTYQSGEATKDENCHNPLSKYIVAKKCIGNSSCNLVKSEFTSSFTCPGLSPNLGNGVGGANDVEGDEVGASGGNGGGNNSEIYNSYYDHKFHDIESKTIPAFTPNEDNFGRAVDLAQMAGTPNQFEGRPGSVIIEEYSDSSFAIRIRNQSYESAGEHTHTISDSAGTTIYVKYTIIGGGGGGGGPGTNMGSNGSGGSKMVGYFKVEGGTVLKIYVGGGGKAGKQGNVQSGGGASLLNPQIIQPIKILDSTKETNFATKILKRIGEFFVSEAYAYVTSCPQYQYLDGCDYTECYPDSGGYICCRPGHDCYPNPTDQTGPGDCTRCANRVCNISEGNGYSAKNNLSGAGSFACDKVGYGGTVDYQCNTPPMTTNNCICSSGYGRQSGNCVANSCKLPTTTGFPRESDNTGKSVTGTGSVTCASGYSGSISYSCGTSGSAPVNGTATITGGTCVANSCKLPTNTGFPKGPQNLGSSVWGGASVTGAGSITCASGYAKGQATDPTYSCGINGANAVNGIATTLGTCVANSCKLPANTGFPTESDGTGMRVEGAGSVTCASGYVDGATAPKYTCVTNGATVTATINTGGTCVANSCTLPANFGFPTGASASVTGAGSVTCASGYRNGATAPKYTCTTDGATAIATINTGGTCVANSCKLPTNTGFPTESDGTGMRVEGAGSVNCAPGYKNGPTPPSYTCVTNGATVTATINAGGTCITNCNAGQELIGGTCQAINCTVTATANDLYMPQSILAYTVGTNTGTFDCKEGYYGTVSYTCSERGPAKNINTTNCIRIQCTLPESGISKVDSGRTVYYAKEEVEYSCASGYKSLIEINKPKYKCVGNASKTNPSALTIINECNLITCEFNYAGVTYSLRDAQSQRITCNQSLGLIGYFNISCSDQGLSSSASSDCRMVQCTVPNNLNTSLTSASKVFFTGGDFREISCQEGYSYSTNCQNGDSNCGIPRYRCLHNAGTINGTFEFQGSCTRIRCDLPSTGDSALNSVLDGTSVDWTSNRYTNTTCKTGFYKGEYEPAYACYKSGYSTINKCLPITCNLEEGVTYSARTNLEYGENKIIDCNKTGYSGTITYNCRTPVTSYFQGFPLGTITTSNINCLPRFRVRRANVGETYDAYTILDASATGGEGGKISDGITFLKGGNGGNSDNFGSGGGGGSASMIAIDDRIIAIAGGGKGGKGGGSSRLNASSEAPRMTPILYSNVFGNYLMLEMEYSDSSEIGLAIGKTSGTAFSIATSTSGTFFNDIVYSLFGNPDLDEASTSLTPGNCNLNPPSLNACVGQGSCNLNNVNSLCSGASCSDCEYRNLIALASYSSGKPKLSLNRGPSPDHIVNCDIMESNDGKLNVAQIEAKKIYSIIINENKCFKREYLGDDYSISGNAEPLIFVKFPNTNKTFSPRIKIAGTYYDILRPESQAGSGIYRRVTIGYIDTTKDYALVKKNIITPTANENYIIQEKMTDIAETARDTPLPNPKRTCMVDFSLNNNIDVMWSRPNSSCINKCPGYKDDPRVGAGRTSRGGNFIKWDSANFGDTVVKKFNGNINAVDNSFVEINTELNPSHFKKDRANTEFVLSRKCGPGGVWEDTKDLCVTSGGSASDSSKAPATGIKSFITNSSGRSIGTEKFTFAGEGEKVNTACLDGFDPQTDEQTYTGNILPRLQYECVMHNGKAEFHPVSNTFDCVKYCSTAPSELSSGAFGKISVTGSVVKVRAQGVQILNTNGTNKLLNGVNQISDGLQNVSCASGFVQKRSGGGTTGTRDVTPQIRCTAANVSWEVFNDCEPASRCYITTDEEGSNIPSINQLKCTYYYGGIPGIESRERETAIKYFNLSEGSECRSGSDLDTPLPNSDEPISETITINGDNNWFPLSKYILSTHRTGGMDHGEQFKQTFAPDSTSEATKYGKCGYCKIADGCVELAGHQVCGKYYYRRKYLKSYYCNDGAWEEIWENSDSDYNRACSGDEWDYWLGQDGEGHPSEKYLGDCTESKRVAQRFKDLQN